MSQYAVKTRFSFIGTFYISADSREEAREFVESHCGLILGGNIHSSLPYEAVDWDFPVHPDKTINRINLTRKVERREKKNDHKPKNQSISSGQ
jgi:hypothetical protein